MRMKTVGLVALNAAFLCAAASTAFLSTGARGALLALIVGVPMLFAVSLSELRLVRKAQDSRDKDAVLHALHRMYSGSRYGRKSMASCLRDSLGASGGHGTNVGAMLSRARRRLLLGEQLGHALCNACPESGPAGTVLRDMGRECSNGLDAPLAVKNAYDGLYGDILLDEAGKAGRLQKYLTVCMAAGTVLPSFAVFAFTGYSMIDYSPALLSFFCVAMLVLVPNLYALVRIHTAGLYET